VVGNIGAIEGHLLLLLAPKVFFWFVYERPVDIDQNQFNQLASLFGLNYRPVQNVNARAPIWEYRPTWGGYYPVTVRNGYSTADLNNGTILQGSLVHMWASLPQDLLFDRWGAANSEDLQIIDSIQDYHTTFRMPSRAVNFTAYFTPLPTVSFTQTTYNNLNLYYAFPKESTACVFWFHGVNERAVDYLPGQTSDIEKFYFVYNVLKAGFGFVIYESTLKNGTTWMWDLTSTVDNNHIINNVDINNLVGVMKLLQPYISESVLFGAGFENGADFAVLAAVEFQFAAAGLLASAGNLAQVNFTIPRVFIILQNDPVYVQAEGFEYFEVLESHQVHSALYQKQPTPIHPLLFTRIPFINQALSIQINQLLINMSIVNPSTYYFLTNPLNNLTWTNFLPPQVPVNMVVSLANVAWSGRQFFDDFTNGKMILFFNSSIHAHGHASLGFAIAGIVVGVVVIGLVAYSIYTLMCKKKTTYEEL